MDLNMQILNALAEVRNPFLNNLMMAITNVGSEMASITIVLIIYWCINKYDGYYMMANFMYGTASVLGLKACFQIPRPFVAHPEFKIVDAARATADGFSFPSGHSENATVLFGGIAILWKNKIIRTICIVMIPLVMLSRLYLGAHYPTDVLCGFIAGIVVLLIISYVLRNRETDAKIIPLVFGTGGIFFLIVTLIIQLGPWQNPDNQQFIQETVKNLSSVTGLMLACALTYPIEKKYISFDTHAVWWAQVLKIAVGSVIMTSIRSLLKPVFLAIFGTFCLGDVLRYFIMAFVGMCIYPITFKWFSRLGKKS